MTFLQAISEQVVEAATHIMAAMELAEPPTMLADLPCNLFAIKLDTGGAEEVIEDVARSLVFAERFVHLSQKIVLGIGTAYNGLHLRLEKDAQDWARVSGGLGTLEALYWRACKHNGFSQVRAGLAWCLYSVNLVQHTCPIHSGLEIAACISIHAVQ